MKNHEFSLFHGKNRIYFTKIFDFAVSFDKTHLFIWGNFFLSPVFGEEIEKPFLNSIPKSSAFRNFLFGKLPVFVELFREKPNDSPSFLYG